MKNNFYISGYPKSSTSYLTRLIASTLNASIGGSCPEQDAIEPIAIKRDSDWIVRKGHYRLMVSDNKPLLPEPHVLNISKLQGEPVFFIIRDPRDIIVSAAHYHNKTIEETLHNMFYGNAYGLGRWDTYVSQWYELMANKAQFIRYEDLLNDPVTILKWCLTIDYDEQQLGAAVKEQSFEKQKPLDKHNLLRKGIAGDYKNYLDQNQIKEIELALGDTMKEFGYEISHN